MSAPSKRAKVVLTKQQMMERVKDPDHKWDQVDSDHLQVRVFGNVAIMTD